MVNIKVIHRKKPGGYKGRCQCSKLELKLWGFNAGILITTPHVLFYAWHQRYSPSVWLTNAAMAFTDTAVRSPPSRDAIKTTLVVMNTACLHSQGAELSQVSRALIEGGARSLRSVHAMRFYMESSLHRHHRSMRYVPLHPTLYNSNHSLM